ncbi:Aminotransferase class I & II [Neofusicoccum parvum]|nr:Aminotransferase class I & II [Neofusicoccum parvum]
MYPPHTGGTQHPSQQQQQHHPIWHSPQQPNTNGAPAQQSHWAHPSQSSPQPSNGAYPPPPPPVRRSPPPKSHKTAKPNLSSSRTRSLHRPPTRVPT